MEMNNKILDEIDKRDIIEGFWDFKEANTKTYTHGFHSYPAMMIPQLVEEFLNIVGIDKNIKNIFDPFMGSGTTLVEGLVHGLDVIGNDLNPLSRLISSVKTNPIEIAEMDKYLKQWNLNFNKDINLEGKIPVFKNINYWFKDYVINDLTIIKENIKKIEDQNFKDFVTLAFSETVRDVSNTRNNEFKLYRMKEETLNNWFPNVFEIMDKNLSKNIQGNNILYKKIIKNSNTVTILDNNVMDLKDIEDDSFDLLITSPPYGDSKTTVAYGQFSRLSNQWLDIDCIDPSQVDNELLGGRVLRGLELSDIDSKTLNKTINELLTKNPKRTKEVYQFFYDLNKGLQEIARVMKTGSYQFWVVGNRTVLNCSIPTHQIIIELFNNLGIEMLTYFTRGIPRKKMPSLNSPTNEKGVKVTTMNDEIIIIFKKK